MPVYKPKTPEQLEREYVEYVEKIKYQLKQGIINPSQAQRRISGLTLMYGMRAAKLGDSQC